MNVVLCIQLFIYKYMNFYVYNYLSINIWMLCIQLFIYKYMNVYVYNYLSINIWMFYVYNYWISVTKKCK